MKSTKSQGVPDAKKNAPSSKSDADAAKPKALFNVQKFVDEKLKVANTVAIGAPPEFPNDEADANSWSISVVSKFLKSKLELPQYVDNFKRHEVDGNKLISLDEDQFESKLEIPNKLHALKLASHAQILRGLVLEKAMIEKPKRVLDWNPTHLAAWLFYEKNCPLSSTQALRGKINTYKLKDMMPAEFLKPIAGLEAEEREAATKALEELIAKAEAEFAEEEAKATKPTAVSAQDADAHGEVEEHGEVIVKPKKGKKAKTAIQKRREKELADAAADKLVFEDSDEGEAERDGAGAGALPNSTNSASKGKAQPPSGAYSSAMAAVLEGVSKPTERGVDRLSNANFRETSGVGKKGLRAIPETDGDSSNDESAAASIRPLPATAKPEKPASAVQSDKRETKNIGVEANKETSDLPVVCADEAVAPAADAHVSTKSSERKKFLNKIAKLRKVVADHAETMEDLREQAHILREENIAIKRQQKELMKDGHQSYDLISTLVNDRNVALQELERVVAMYDAHTSRERDTVTRELHALVDDTYRAKAETQALRKARSRDLAELGNLDTSIPASSVPELNQTAPARLKTERRERTDNDSSGSDLDDPAPSQRLAKTTGAANPAAYPAVVNLPATSSAKPAPAAVPVPEAAKASTSESVSTGAVMKPEVRAPAAPSSSVSAAPPPVSKAVSVATAAASEPPVDLVRMLDKTADAVHTMWVGILRKYRVPRSHATDAFSDSKILLRHISTAWIGLGKQMLNDAHSPDTPKDIRKALKGLERCAKKAVLASTRRAKKLPDNPDAAPSPAKTSRTALASAGATGFAKKQTQSLPGSTAFPDVDTGLLGGDGEAGQQDQGVHVHRHHRAAGMVFGLALVQRVFSRYATDTEDKAQLLFLLNKVNHGDLPISEISRDNMRDFLDSHIGIDLQWDKFDSVCQKLDPDRNGFISTASVTHAFEQLAPLVDKLPPSEALFTELFLLSVATDTLSKPKLPINETLLSLILHNSKSSASFQKYIEKEQTRIQVEDAGFAADPISPRSGKMTGDARVAEQQLFVSDVLYELSKEFTYKAYAAPDLRDKKLPASSLKQLDTSQRRFKRCKAEFQFITQHHQETCSGIARALQVYEGASRKRLVSQLSHLFLTFLKFRRQCVQRLLDAARLTETAKDDGTPSFPEFSTVDTPAASPMKSTAKSALGLELAAETLGGEVNKALNQTLSTSALVATKQTSLTVDQLQTMLVKIELNLATLTGLYIHDHEEDTNDGTFSPLRMKRKETPVFKLPEDPTSAEEYEAVLCELLGIPLPICPLHGSHTSSEHCFSLSHAQVRVEKTYQQALTHYALEESLAQVAPEPPKPLAASQALKDIQQSLYQDLWGSTVPEDLPDAPHRSGGGDPTQATLRVTLKVDAPPIHVVEEVNDLMHKQRVEQCAQYLGVLNEKATRRKRMIRSLMNLWQAAKVTIEDGGRVPKFSSEESIELKRLQAMPREEIIAQTNAVQQLLVHDMQEPTGTKLYQLSQRINLLRQGVANETIPDEDLAIVASLREISALENALLQANTDAMRLASRIVKQLGAKKHVEAW